MFERANTDVIASQVNGHIIIASPRTSIRNVSPPIVAGFCILEAAMQAQKPMDKSTERKWMAEADRERHERERDLPVDRRHLDPPWVQAFWLARRVLA